MADDTRLPDAKVHTNPGTNQEKLDFLLDLALDTWWESRSVSGAGRSLLNQGIPKLGPDWKPIPGVHTTPQQELSALPQNFANLKAQLDALKASIPVAVNAAVKAALTAAPAAPSAPAAVDYAAIASAVATELAARLSKGA